MKLANAHGVPIEQIKINKVFQGTFSFEYTVLKLAKHVTNKIWNACTELKQQFNSFVDLKVHPMLYRESFDVSMFDARGFKDFANEGSTFEVGPEGRKKMYKQPHGWVGYGLKVGYVTYC